MLDLSIYAGNDSKMEHPRLLANSDPINVQINKWKLVKNLKSCIKILTGFTCLPFSYIRKDFCWSQCQFNIE